MIARLDAKSAVVLIRHIQRLTSGILLAVLAAGCGEPELATSPPMDALEQELEIPHHEPLLERVVVSADRLSEFTTDGCSGGLTVAWEQFSEQYTEFTEIHGGLPPWQDCCVTHDRAYHFGGGAASSALESFAQRRDADLALRACVVHTGMERSGVLRSHYDLTAAQVQALYENIGDLMYRAVRLGGIPCTEAPWRWGYGWPKCSLLPSDG